MTDTTTPSLGPISEGTHLPADLIPSYLQALREHSDKTLTAALESCEDSPLGTMIHYETLGWDCSGETLETYATSENCTWDVEALTTALEEIAPPLCYFGAQEGDGACFGFWVSESALQDAKDDPDTHVGPDEPTDPSIGAWVEINERGNIVYREEALRIEWVEIWSCV